MHRWLVVLIVAAALIAAPRASAGDAPIGRLGDTLRVDTGTLAAVTVAGVRAVDPPPGFGFQRGGNPAKGFGFPDGGVYRADVTVHPITTPTPFQLAATFTFDGVTPFADVYTSRPSDAPDALDIALGNAPAGATVHGGVYWDVQRDPVSNVVLLDRKTGVHLAQWNR